MIDTDYIGVEIQCKPLGDLFDYKQALIRIYNEIWCRYGIVNKDYYIYVRDETDNIKSQYILSFGKIIFVKEILIFLQKICDQNKKEQALNILYLKSKIPFDIVLKLNFLTIYYATFS